MCWSAYELFISLPFVLNICFLAILMRFICTNCTKRIKCWGATSSVIFYEYLHRRNAMLQCLRFGFWIPRTIWVYLAVCTVIGLKLSASWLKDDMIVFKWWPVMCYCFIFVFKGMACDPVDVWWKIHTSVNPAELIWSEEQQSLVSVRFERL